MIRPTYYKLWKVLNLFVDGKFEIYEDTPAKKVAKMNFEIRKKNELIFDYLIAEGYIEEKGLLGLASAIYELTQKGKLLKDKLNPFWIRLEYFIKDYPTLLGGLIGGVIGSLITGIIGILLG